LEQLRAILVRGLRAVLARNVPEQADALAEDFAQDALVKILESLDTFRGDSRFTTWAQKIAVRIALTELRRKRWEDVSLDELASDAGPGLTPSSDSQSDPSDEAGLRLIVAQVQTVMQEALSQRQLTAITAVMMHGMPLEEVARRMGTNRNALYKLLHDARKCMKRELTKRGFSPEEILESF
jgi:RNA polymerase sigma-70 factor (ECF subfamily)